MSKIENTYKFHPDVFLDPIKFPKAYAVPKMRARKTGTKHHRTYRQKIHEAFFEAIANHAGFPRHYKNLDPNRLVLKWKGKKITSVHVQSYPNSLMSSSAGHWKDFKSLVEQNLPLASDNIFVMFDYHHEGKLSLCAVSNADMMKDSLGYKLQAGEEIHDVVYSAFAKTNHPFPCIHEIKMGTHNDDSWFDSFAVVVKGGVGYHEREKFEDEFLPKYCDGSTGSQQWYMDWDPYPRDYSFRVCRLIDLETLSLELKSLVID